jgi:hypothetical protein
MNRNPSTPFLQGAIGGLALAVAFLAFFGGATALTTVDLGGSGAGPGEPVFMVDQTSLWLLVLFLGALGGLVLAAVVYGTGSARYPAAARFRLWYAAPAAMVLASVMAFSTVSLGVEIAGSTTEGTVIVPVTAMAVIAAAAGLIAGMATAPIVDALSQPAVIGEANDATPVSSRAFWMDLGGAIGLPALAIAIGALLAISMAEILLSADSSEVAVAIFAGAGAVILGGTAAFALRPWDRS